MPTVKDLSEFNKNLLTLCDDDIKREHYEKKALISELFKDDLKEMLPLPKERFKVTRLCAAPNFRSSMNVSIS